MTGESRYLDVVAMLCGLVSLIRRNRLRWV